MLLLNIKISLDLERKKTNTEISLAKEDFDKEVQDLIQSIAHDLSEAVTMAYLMKNCPEVLINENEIEKRGEA